MMQNDYTLDNTGNSQEKYKRQERVGNNYVDRALKNKACADYTNASTAYLNAITIRQAHTNTFYGGVPDAAHTQYENTLRNKSQQAINARNAKCGNKDVACACNITKNDKWDAVNMRRGRCTKPANTWLEPVTFAAGAVEDVHHNGAYELKYTKRLRANNEPMNKTPW